MNDSDVCQRCEKLVVDHTIREVRKCHPAEDLNLAFEKSPEPTEVDIATQQAAGLIVMSAVVETMIGKIPALVFRFAKASGLEFYPDMTLILDDVAMANTATLVSKSAMAAIEAAHR